MTCIVGYRDKGRVYIGGDNRASDTSMYIEQRRDLKVFKLKNMLIGCTTSYRMIQILQYSFTPPEHKKKDSDMKYLVDSFIPKIIKTYKKLTYMLDGDKEGGNFLLGYNNKLYNVYDNFQVAEPELPYTACGCGQPYALGAMHILDTLKITPEEKITRAIQAAELHNAGVGSPIQIMSI